MGLHGCVPRFIARHGSLILTILAGIGLVGTTVVTARQAPKADDKLWVALRNKRYDRATELVEEAEANGKSQSQKKAYSEIHRQAYEQAEEETRLTVKEKIEIAGPYYIPVILLGLLTLGCMAGAQILNTKQQAALIGAYALLQKEYSAYRQEIREEYGAEADKKAYLASQRKIENLEEEIKRLENIKGVCSFGIATIPGLIFRSDMANIERAFLHFNRNLCLRGWADLEELYSFLGLPEDQWEFVKKKADENYGWNQYINEVEFGVTWLDYRLEEMETEDGNKAYLIYFDVPPYCLEELPDGSDIDHAGAWYSGYDYTEAKRILQEGLDKVPMLIDSATHYVGAPMLCGW